MLLAEIFKYLVAIGIVLLGITVPIHMHKHLIVCNHELVPHGMGVLLEGVPWRLFPLAISLFQSKVNRVNEQYILETLC